MNFGGVHLEVRSRRDGEVFSPQQFERELYSALEREHPGLWRVCYPRIYSELRQGQYYSPQRPARQLMIIALKVLNGQVGPSEKYEYHLASHLAKFRVPTYWLSPAIAEALKLTTPPGRIDWYNMPLPFDAGVFMLPKGSLVHPADGDVVFVCYARFRAGQQYHSPLIPDKPYTSLNGGMMIAALVQNGYFIHWNISLDAYGPVITLPELQHLMTTNRQEHGTAFPVGGMTSEDFALGPQVAQYVFSTLMLMTARPDLITAASLTNRLPAKKNKQPREFWSPAIIGEHYKIRRESHPSQGGTHASPRFHWVKGFWREQPYGPSRKLRHAVWIEPYTRGGGE